MVVKQWHRCFDLRPLFIVAFFFLCAVFSPIKSYALAGWVETFSEYEYSPFSTIWYAYSDVCQSATSRCLFFQTKGGTLTPYKLSQVNMPTDPPVVFVMGQMQSESKTEEGFTSTESKKVLAPWPHQGDWVLFDVVNDRVLIQSPDKQEVLAHWNQLNLPEPRWIQAAELPKQFEKTKEQEYRDFEDSLSLWVPIILFIVVPAVFVVLILFVVLFLMKRFRQRRHEDEDR